MNLSTIEMPRAEAIRAFQHYKAAVDQRHSEEDAQIMRGYRELANGKRLLDLPATMREAGVKPFGRGHMPALAICNATAKVCHCEVDWNGQVWFADASKVLGGPRISSGVTEKYVAFPRGTFTVDRRENARAVVPIVPPQFRPASGLGGYHILWEAEWQRTAPRDPALLKHLGGDLWAVLAIWDLTELERSIIMGRRR